MNAPKHRIYLILLSFLCFNQASAQDKKPFEVFHEMEYVEQMLTRLLDYQGIRLRSKTPLDVEKVTPREVYCLARLMAIKSNAISSFHLKSNLVIPDNPLEEITPTHVFNMTQLTAKTLNSLLSFHGLDIPDQSIQLDETKTPTDVFKASFHINWMLNQYLPYNIEPKHVYDNVVAANQYVEIFLSHYNLPIPDAYPFTRGHKPHHVVDQLQRCYLILEQVAIAHDFPLMHMEATAISDTTEPADSYDYATLLQYQLTYLYTISTGINAVPPNVPKSENRTPDHVFQMSKNLEMGLLALIGK